MQSATTILLAEFPVPCENSQTIALVSKCWARSAAVISTKKITGVGEESRDRAHCDAMIYPCDNQTQTRWDRGEFKVQLIVAGQARAVGFCDGTEADVAELRARAETEGATMTIQKKLLKTGREIWTLG
jgi:hypothetical protein